jgi:hypothetical protein
MTPFDIKNSIDQKRLLEWDAQLEKDYLPFIVNKALSFNIQTILFSNEMNLNPKIPKKWQYDFLFYAVPKGKRFDKWIKSPVDEDEVSIIQAYFDINKNRALEFLSILTKEQINIIKSKQEKGGRYA